MSELSDNPYRPPVVQEPAAPSDGAWQVAGRTLLFHDGARLPPVDLFTGRAGGDLIPCSQRFKATIPPLSALLISAVTMIAIIVIDPVRPGYPAKIVLICAIMMTLIRVFSPRSTTAVARLHWFASASDENRRQKRRTAANILSAIGILGLVGDILLAGNTPFPWLLMICTGSVFKSRLRPGGVRDGWLVLYGVNPEALRELAGREPVAGAAAPEMRLRKVHAIYLYRFPFPLLVAGQWWNPILVATIMVMKLTRSPNLVRDQFDVLEAESIREEDCDPDLREMAAAVRREPDFASWSLAHASRLDSPAGDHRTDCLVFLSPDRVHSLTLALSRFVSAQTSRSVPEKTFRTWLDDGTVLLTTNVPMLRPFPATLKARRVRAPLDRLHAAHMDGLAGASPQALADGGDLLIRLRREGEERRAVLEDAGLYGPVREEEFPVSPAGGKFPG